MLSRHPQRTADLDGKARPSAHPPSLLQGVFIRVWHRCGILATMTLVGNRNQGTIRADIRSGPHRIRFRGFDNLFRESVIGKETEPSVASGSPGHSTGKGWAWECH